MKKLIYILPLLLLAACYSNNCPYDSVVTCNYNFYDMEGTAIIYNDTITVSLILPGGRTVYVYRRLGYATITSDTERPDLVEAGYTQSMREERNDTIIVNKSYGKGSISVPMSYYFPVDTLLFKYASVALPDTIFVEHESYPHVDLPECGSYRYHLIKHVRSTDAAIDHIEISNPTVDYEGNENIKIYFNGVAE